MDFFLVLMDHKGFMLEEPQLNIISLFLSLSHISLQPSEADQ